MAVLRSGEQCSWRDSAADLLAGSTGHGAVDGMAAAPAAWCRGDRDFTLGHECLRRACLPALVESPAIFRPGTHSAGSGHSTHDAPPCRHPHQIFSVSATAAIPDSCCMVTGCAQTQANCSNSNRCRGLGPCCLSVESEDAG